MSRPIRVLHVDDEPDFGDTVATFLERENERLDVLTAASAAEGLDHLAAHDVDCVVSDYDMSGMDGIAFLEAVREDHPDLPFVLFTGKGSEEVASDAISAGVTDYLQKELGTDQYAILANRIVNAVEHVRSDRRVERSERRLRKIVDQLPHLVYVVDLDGEYLLANEALADLHDTTVDELEGATVAEIHDEEFADRLLTDVRAIHDFGEARSFSEIPAEDATGREHIFDSQLVPFPLAETDDAAILGIATDVTERTQRERELEQYETIVEIAGDGAFVLDADGHYEMVNQKTAERTGYDESELVGAHGSLVLDDADIETAKDAVLSVLRTEAKDFAQFEATVHARDGADYPVEVRMAPLLENGEVVGSVGTSRDIADRTQRERDLRRKNERLEEFASVVSHDLRNPLHVAQARVELAREECDSPHLADARSAHDRMATLIDELLALAREGETVEKTAPVDLPTVVEACRETVETAGATLVVETERTVQSDRERLQQLFENLLRNAVEHGSTSPPSQAREDAVEHGSTAPPSPAPEEAVEGGDDPVTVRVGDLEDGFFVEDDGPGIPRDERDRALEGGYSTSSTGTGLGLSIVQDIADAHGWDLAVTASEDGGARFEFTGVGGVT